MATKPSTLFLSNPWRGYSTNNTSSSSSSSPSRLIPTSCKMRARNLSSQKRQQAKRVSTTQLPMNKSLQSNSDEDTTVQSVATDLADLISSSHQQTLSEDSLLTGDESTKVKSEAENSSPYRELLIDENADSNDESIGDTGSSDESIEDTDSKADHISSSHLESLESNDESTESDADYVPSSHQENTSIDEVARSSSVPIDTDLGEPTILEETSSMTGKARNGEHVQLEDLIGMIKNAEKNILLLNQARLRSAEDLDKILAEKENLKGEINMLEARLAETDSQIEGAVQAKVHVELLEGELKKLKLELSEKDAAVGGIDNIDDKEKILNKDNDSSSSVGKDLSLLREENLSLKDDIHLLKQELTNLKETDERILALEDERSSLEAIVKNLESRLLIAEDDVSKISTLKLECRDLWAKVGNLQELLDKATKQADEAISVLQQNYELRKKVDRLEESFEEAKLSRISSEKMQQYNELMQQKISILEERLIRSDEEIHFQVQLYHESIKEFQDILETLKEESKKKALDEPVDEMPWEFWSRLLLMIDGWFLEKKISSDDAKLLGQMTWKRDKRICNAYLASKSKKESERLVAFLNLISSPTSSGLHIIHIAAEMAPVAKVGGLGDVVSGLGKALQKKGHLVEIVIPKYDCMQYDRVSDLRVLDAVVESYFDGRLYKNKIWVGIVEGLPVYFIEPQHPANFFGRGQFYGENDDFKRFSYFSRVALELLFQAGKRPDIIHCHDWQTAFVAPLYWDLYVNRGFDSARICFTCHNFEYQGTTNASELGSCGLDVSRLNRPDRMQDHSAHDRVNPLKGAIVYSNIVTTVSPTYAQEVRTPEGGHGLHRTLNSHSKKFIGVLNGIDTDAWDPATDNFLKVQFNADDLQGKMENKEYLRKYLKLSSADSMQPLVGCITRLVPQKGVHLIRQAIYRTLELGGQFILLGSSPVEHIQREFEGIAKHFESHPHIRLILKYDEALSHSIYAASDMFVIPSLFEPCGLTQMIAMRYGSIPIVRKTGGLNDSVFDVDDETIPLQFRNGFTFLNPDEQGMNSVLERAFARYTRNSDSWRELVRRNMMTDFSWDASASQYIELYQDSVDRRDSAARAGALKHT